MFAVVTQCPSDTPCILGLPMLMNPTSPQTVQYAFVIHEGVLSGRFAQRHKVKLSMKRWQFRLGRLIPNCVHRRLRKRGIAGNQEFTLCSFAEEIGMTKWLPTHNFKKKKKKEKPNSGITHTFRLSHLSVTTVIDSKFRMNILKR